MTTHGAAAETRIETEARAWQAWESAWDRARKYDEKQGRPYNKARYSQAAHNARAKVLARVSR